jgi:hypothetical protein
MDPATLAAIVAQATAHMGAADLAASQANISAQKKRAQEAEKARYAEPGRELVETVLAEQPCEPSPTSTRVGRSTSSLPIEIDGKQYTYYVSIKDVAASEQREKDVEAGRVVLEKPKRGRKATQDEPTDEPEASTDDDTTVVTLPTKPAA